jgi:crotonobetainyl-CoA:carnitine CoA-transferase CaiB-like acyl-CoA transferase
MVKDPQIKHNEMILEYNHPKVGKVKTTGFPVKFSDTTQHIYRPAPMLNQHKEEIIKEFTDINK